MCINRFPTSNSYLRISTKYNLSLLNATLDSIADGVLVMNREGRIEKFNRKFVQIWRIPESIIETKEDSQALAFVRDQLKDPQGFLVDVKELRDEGYDLLELKDGRTYEQYTLPQRIGDQLVGRVWSFRDVTKHIQMEQSLIKNEEEAKRLSRENEILAGIGRIISSTMNIEEIYERFAEEARKLIPFDRILINFVDVEKDTVINVYIAGKGISGRKVGEIYPLHGSGNVEMMRTKSTLLIQTEDFSEYKDRFPMLLSTFQAGFRSIMNVPLFSKGQIIGGLLFRSLNPQAYTDENVKLAERIADQIAGTIANALLFKELTKALAQVKQLSGMLPICASCKKIRDDKGYWTQIETYIRDHSGAEFSHGICPDCFKKLYPDMDI